ncbi:MAG: UDP-glucose 4-epimerase GalE [Oligoflexales bacterium]
MKSKTYIVTGGCGYIGSQVCKLLSEQSSKVVVIDNLSTGSRKSLLYDEMLVEGSIGDEGLLNEVFSTYPVEGVLHFAASISVPESVAKPLEYYENNTTNTLKLLKACQKHNVQRFVFSSTASVYGEPTSEKVKETDPCLPNSPYGWSKLMAEQIIKDYGLQSSLRYVMLRYFNVAGASSDKKLGSRNESSRHVIKMACEAVRKNSEFTIHGDDYATKDGTGIRDYIHVEDLAQAHLDALTYLGRDGQSCTLNCGYGYGFSVRDIIKSTEDVVKRPVSAVVGPRRAGDIASVVADNSLILRTLDWTPKFNDLRYIIESALTWENQLRGK